MSALFARIGPGILFTHSQAGGPGWLTAIKNHNVKAIVALEPGSGFVFPQGELPPQCQAPPAPCRRGGVAGGFPEAHAHSDRRLLRRQLSGRTDRSAGQDNWRVRLAMAQLWVDTINRHGGDARLVHLPESEFAATRTSCSRISTMPRSPIWSRSFSPRRNWISAPSPERQRGLCQRAAVGTWQHLVIQRLLLPKIEMSWRAQRDSRKGQLQLAGGEPRRSPASWTTSPSSLVNGASFGTGSSSSTASEGRQSLVPSVGHDDRPVDQDRMREHGVEQLRRRRASDRPAPARHRAFPSGAEALGPRSPSQRPARAALPCEGGVLRYSITTGSMPAWRISASVLREVPQAGL